MTQKRFNLDDVVAMEMIGIGINKFIAMVQITNPMFDKITGKYIGITEDKKLLYCDGYLPTENGRYMAYSLIK